MILKIDFKDWFYRLIWKVDFEIWFRRSSYVIGFKSKNYEKESFYAFINATFKHLMIYRKYIPLHIDLNLGSLSLKLYLPSQSSPTILVSKMWVGLWPWKKSGLKYGMQKAGCKKQGHSKREQARLSLLFLNNNDPVFCTLFF